MKQNRPFMWLLVLLVTTSLLWACNNEAPKPEESKTDTVPAVQTTPTDTLTKDSLPPVDSGATTRPEPIPKKPVANQ